jgi:hypothetical protein
MNEPFPGYDDIAALGEWLDHHENKCGHTGLVFIGPEDDSSKFARLNCVYCGAYEDWMPKPRTKQEQKTRRPRRVLRRLDEDRCLICSATRMEAGLLGRTLVAHHMIDRALLIDAGYAPDELVYLSWACSQPCHPMITALRQATGSALTMKAVFPPSDGAA